MKKTSILFILMLFSLFGWSQTTYLVYSYDPAGNRVKRELIVEDPKIDSTVLVQSNTNLIGDATTIQEQLKLISEYDLKVYPNPTDGKLVLSIGNYNNSIGEIKLYHQTGSLLLSQKTLKSNNPIDISNRPTGTYILELLIENKGVQWKIVKK